ncbi:phage tail tape measure protein [Bosea sp. (in: a-proteobacteria)]|uniref:phage tail tape measure protein n=1 Tax=Bosea sp. (in: a-proteobacteria) TaxID=1871050 RepID=UPI001AD42D22|nr:phage tail tape measure protein [Bosea sp. (in: a-proteobacteria)]MBN9438988.1 phage tail tape measure protein [Bosea sp. (in: a-proteobacteria)]
MSGRNMAVSVLVKLVDGLTSPLRGMMRGITSVGSGIANVGRQIGVVGGALAAISFMAPLQQAAAWDAQLRDIAITAGKTGGAVEQMIGETSKRYEKLGLEVGQKSETLAKGAQLLIAAGMNDKLIDQLMPTIGRVSTAAGAAVEDASKTAFALSETLKIKPEEMELALAKLVTAGKLGRFEFKNMASEFPGLTAQMAKLGVTGMEAVNFLGASLQTAMLGTDDPSQAANNLKNFLTKINAPEAIKKFEKELKVDVVGVMTDASAKGINPVEAVIQKMTDKMKVPKAEIDKILKQAGKSGMSDKDQEKAVRGRIEQLIQGSKVGKIFADMQVLDFLIPMLLNTAKFKEMKQQIAAAGIDVIADDFASRMRGLSGQMMLFGEVGTQVMRRIGLAFASNLPMANRALTSLLQWIAAIDAKWPGLIDGVLSWTAVLLAAGVAIAILTPVFSALAAALALLISPIGLVVAGVAALAAGASYLYQNWATVGPQLAALWNDIAAKFSAAWESIRSGQALEAVIAWLAAKIPELAAAVIAGLPGMVEAGGKLVAAIGEGLTAGMIAVTAFGITIVAEIASAVGNNLAALTQAGGNLIAALWDGMKAKFAEFIAWIATIPSQIIAAIGSIDLSNIIKWPSLPSWLGGGAGQPGAAGAAKNAPAPSVDPMGNSLGGGFNPASSTGGSIGGSSGFTRQAAANSNVAVGGRIVVEAAEGTRITNVESTNPAVPVTPNRGAMLGRA